MQHAVEDDSDNRKEERRARHKVQVLLVVPRPRRPTLAVAQDGVLYDISSGVVGASVLILGRDGKEASGKRLVKHLISILCAPKILGLTVFAFRDSLAKRSGGKKKHSMKKKARSDG